MRAVTSPGCAASRRHAPVWIGMVAIVAVSWFHLARTGEMAMRDAMAMGGSHAPSFVAVFAMWAVMMVAMMLPAVSPSAAVFSGLAWRRDAHGATLATAMYVAGYATTWVGCAIPAASVQWMLTHALLLDPMSRSTSLGLSAGILLTAGAYQFTPFKRACLSKCRTPLGFFMTKWRDAATGAFVLGLEHGVYCAACCWALMAVLFVVGAMNLAWMAVVTLVVLGEKIATPGWHFARVVGASLILAGLWFAVRSWAGS